jgi:hypothetical protein|tara:strand:- start:47 stop:445 length:399 start_codon:yes stop_codon:yes gene_type:complete
MSEILTNKLTGVSTAGSIVVTGEGNSTTTNLQQGLSKAWINFNGSSTVAIRDSFNVSSLDDDGTGTYGINVNNSFGSADHCPTSTNDAVANYSASEINTVATTGIDALRCFNIGGSAIDSTLVYVSFHGDLA